MHTGDKYILARKLIKGPTELMYSISDREYYLNSEDVRVINMKHTEVHRQVRRSSRSAAISNSNDRKTYEFNEQEIDKLRLRCWNPATQVVNL